MLVTPVLAADPLLAPAALTTHQHEFELCLMRTQTGSVAGYNGQAVVTTDQVIAGAMLSHHPAGRTLLHPLLGTCRRQLTQAGIRPRLRAVLAGSGYVSEENFARASQD